MWNYDDNTSDSNQKFWMITGDRNSPKVRHASYSAARAEAERLARNNPGTKFYILTATEMFEQPSGINRVKL